MCVTSETLGPVVHWPIPGIRRVLGSGYALMDRCPTTVDCITLRWVYASDLTLLSATTVPQVLIGLNVQATSIDHAMWFCHFEPTTGCSTTGRAIAFSLELS